ncbi:MAG: nuclear transport factor 2 family protein [Turneriella sp.]
MNNWITTTLLATVAVTGSMTGAAKPANSEARLREKISAFYEAGDNRDVAAMDGILDENFRLVAFFGDAASATQMDKTGYTTALSAGKIGGIPREKKILSLEVRGNHAACRIKSASTKLSFDTFMHWVFSAGDWRLVNDLTHAVAK